MQTESFKDLTRDINKNIKQLGGSQKDVLQSFGALSKAAMADGALDAKMKELIALAIGVAKQCDGCIGFHTQALARLGASEQEVHDMLGVAVYMGGGPALMYAATARAAFAEAIQK